MILMLFNRCFFKKYALPNIDNSDYKLRVKQSYGVRNGFNVHLEIINRVWKIKSTNKYQLIQHKQNQYEIELIGDTVFNIGTSNGEKITAIVIDTPIAVDSMKKLDISSQQILSIGTSPQNQIQYSFFSLVSGRHCTLERYGGKCILRDFSSNGVYVNHIAVNCSTELRFGDFIEIFGLKIFYLNSILAVSAHTGELTISSGIPEYKATVIENRCEIQKHRENFFNRSPRVLTPIAHDQIVIEPPTTPQFSRRRSILMTIGPSFTMAIPMLLGCGMMAISSTMSGGMSGMFMMTGVITALGSAIFGGMWAFLNVRNTRKEEAEDEEARFNAYGNYLMDISEKLNYLYLQNANALYERYPAPSECCRYDVNSPQLWSRNPSHGDFMYYRLGVGNLDFQVDIQIPREQFSVTFDALKDKPAMIKENYRTLKNVPVGVDFSEHKIYGIAGGKNKLGVYAVVNNIITQIVSGSGYTDVKIAFCTDKDKCVISQWEYIKWLPHVWSENRKFRYYATDKAEVSDVLFELSNIIRHRSEQRSSSHERMMYKPHYFLFIYDASMLDDELIRKYIFDDGEDYGLTTFIMTDFFYNLPNKCENIIQNDDEICGYYNALGNRNNALMIDFDRVSVPELYSFAKRLSSITLHESEDDTAIPSSLDFFEMYGVSKPEDFAVAEQWRKNRTYSSMGVVIGKKAGNADCVLDIHEKYHGPHGLIAGTTGSGKSELMQTFILSLALNFSPDDIAFFIIDFKGGGMANLFSDLPHVAGQISNLSGNQIHRAMVSIKSENQRRQRIFSENGVNNINSYTRLYKGNETTVPIPHLIIIIDEFAELKREEPDFMRELISVAQVGRSLGVHLILATQKPAGTVDDNIWSNAKFRLCLRVQDRQDSNDMLHKPDAAYLTQAGRCYLQVGNDEIYELFQSGWSGAAYDSFSGSVKSEIATMITNTGKAALYGSHTKKKLKENEKNRWYKFLYVTALSLIKKGGYSSIDNSLSAEILTRAEAAGYNLGTGNLNIQAVKNFIALMPEREMKPSDAVRFIVERASAGGMRLPEIKEKTQLEVLVDYIKNIAEINGFNGGTTLWTPLLRKKIILSEIAGPSLFFDGNKWPAHERGSINAVVGFYDDPQNQVQLPLIVDFSNGGHLAVCGSVVSGKSTFVQTLVFSAAASYSPDELNFYLLDFSGGLLENFAGFPHTGGIIKDNEPEKTEKFFRMISKTVAERKALFRGGNFSQYVKSSSERVPAIIIVIDNFAGFREKTGDAYDEILISLSREGVSYGVFLVLTSAGFGVSEINSRIGDNIRTVISLEMSDKFRYMDVLRTTVIDVIPESGVKGRGLAYVDGRILEFQTALAVDAEDDYKRNRKIEQFGAKISDAWNGRRARQIPSIPKNPTYSDLVRADGFDEADISERLLPFAYRDDDASVYSLDLSRIYCYTIIGKKRTGKTNLLKLLMLSSRNKKCRRVVFEKNSSELRATAKELGCRCLCEDKDVLDFFTEITGDFVQRNKFKRELVDAGMSDSEIFVRMSKFEPIFIFISDLCSFMDTIYHPCDGVGNLSAFFENIFEKGSMHNIFFFGCLNPDDAMDMAAYKAYRLYTSEKSGVNLGGNLASQRLFNFQNIKYNDLSRASKKGEGLVPNPEDDTVADKIIVPLC